MKKPAISRALPTPKSLSIPEIMARFPDEESAVKYLEFIRWPNGVVCPHCQSTDRFWVLTSNPEKRRVGLRQCAACRMQFRVTFGTIFEDSHIPLHLWIVAWYIVCGAKKGISALQMQRHLGLGSYRSAWFLMHRIRHAMANPSLLAPLAGIVEADETYVGGKRRAKPGEDFRGKPGKDSNKVAVVSLVERDGNKRSMVMDRVTARNVTQAIHQHVADGTTVMTDQSPVYCQMGKNYRRRSVNHGKGEYVVKDGNIHTNTVESSFSLIKRGIVGSFHHISKKHLPRYLAEFDFRWNHRKTTDGERTVAGLQGLPGKRLTYKPLTKKQVIGNKGLTPPAA